MPARLRDRAPAAAPRPGRRPERRPRASVRPCFLSPKSATIGGRHPRAVRPGPTRPRRGDRARGVPGAPATPEWVPAAAPGRSRWDGPVDPRRPRPGRSACAQHRQRGGRARSGVHPAPPAATRSARPRSRAPRARRRAPPARAPPGPADRWAPPLNRRRGGRRRWRPRRPRRPPPGRQAGRGAGRGPRRLRSRR